MKANQVDAIMMVAANYSSVDVSPLHG